MSPDSGGDARLQVAGHTNLSKLGILLKSNACQDKVLRNTLIRASPKIDILALATFDTPNSAYIEELATICPQLRELTLCFFETGKARRWPDTSSDYAAAFSNFEHLSRLALNHDDTARDPYESNTDSDTESDEGSFEDRFLARKEQRVQGRQALCQDLAMSCPSLTEVAFCPLEQEQSRWRVKRKGDAAAEISCIDAVDKFFWQTLWLS